MKPSTIGSPFVVPSATTGATGAPSVGAPSAPAGMPNALINTYVAPPTVDPRAEARQHLMRELAASEIDFVFPAVGQTVRLGPHEFTVQPLEKGMRIVPLVNMDDGLGDDCERILALAYERGILFCVFETSVLAYHPDYPCDDKNFRLPRNYDVEIAKFSSVTEALTFIRTHDPQKSYDSELTYRAFFQFGWLYAAVGIARDRKDVFEWALRAVDHGIDMGADEDGTFRYSQKGDPQLKLSILVNLADMDPSYQRPYQDFFTTLVNHYTFEGNANARAIVVAQCNEMLRNLREGADTL